MTLNKRGWVRGGGPPPHPTLVLKRRDALSRKGRGQRECAPRMSRRGPYWQTICVIAPHPLGTLQTLPSPWT